MTDTIGKYRVIREIGKGATATVYLVEDPERGERFALKRVRFGIDDEGQWTRRLRKLFQTEGMLAGRLEHPHIVRVFETVVTDEEAYLVMEYVEGRALADFIAVDRLLPVHRVIGIVFKCCLALDYAYRQGVVHRDIKPANILIAENDQVKIADFGLSLDVTKKSERDSTFIMGVGSPAYMSPEQIKGHPLNQKTDLYSLGVVLYQLLTGRLPFRGANQSQLIYKIINADAPAVSSLNPNVPAVLDRILGKALEKDLYSRYKNGAEMAQDLAAVRYQIVDDDYVPVDRSRFTALRGLSFFRDFADVELWEVLRISTWREIDGRVALMREGDEDNRFGVIISGEVEVSLSGRRIARLGAGEVVGEMAHLDSGSPRRSATVTTLAPLTYLEVSNSALALSSEECLEHFRQALVSKVVRRLALANATLAKAGEPAAIAAHADQLELAPLDGPVKPAT
ncbi:serine/threonine-protein kinase PrkC [mine drainage metagenome]|uniref:Serine/threonine-protein kinase PrkC n=1 Tax=mine drainage metagenome TaxID=410659 RepID=A0A1J5R1V6_9ZZZZ